MANARDQMKMIEAELERVRNEIEKLRVEEALLLKMMGKMTGTPVKEQDTRQVSRTRSPNVKPVVLDIMRSAGPKGATSAEVDEQVRTIVPTVAKDTVGSVLSRLKADGALVYDGERYYERQFAPKASPNPFDKGWRTVVN